MGKLKTAFATVLAAPKIIAAKRQEAQANADADIIKLARNAKGSPNLDAQGNPTEGFKARSLAVDAKARTLKRAGRLSSDGFMPTKKAYASGK